MIDASMIQAGGGFTYAVNVIPRLAQARPGGRFRVLVRSDRLARSLPDLPNLEVERLPAPTLGRRLRLALVEAPRLAAAWGADLYYSVAETAPPRAPCPVVASFQNLNVFAPFLVRWPLRTRLRLLTLNALARLSARRCERIHFVSEHGARSIGDALGMPERRRVAIHHGIDVAAWRRASRCERPSFERSYILSVSSVYPYKNYVRLIEAYAELARRRRDVPDLVIAGDDQDPPYSAEIQRARAATGGLAGAIHILGELPYSAIPGYYAGAAMFVFPSYFESFGLPLLEAMASDVPIVASELPTFREVAGDAALYADPFDAASIAAAMEQALFAPGVGEALVRRGRERVAGFTWEETAARLLATFDEVLAEHGAPPE